MGAGPHNEPLASPRNLFLGRKGRVAELVAELLGRSFLPFPHFAAVDYHIMRVAFSLNLDLAKFDQPRFHYLDVPLARGPKQGRGILTLRAVNDDCVMRVYDEARNFIATHEHKGASNVAR